MPTWAVVIGMLLRLQGEKAIDTAGVVVVSFTTNWYISICYAVWWCSVLEANFAAVMTKLSEVVSR